MGKKGSDPGYLMNPAGITGLAAFLGFLSSLTSLKQKCIF